MRQSFLEHPGGGTRSSTGITCNGESVNLPNITAASKLSQPLSFSNYHQPSYHVDGIGDSLGMPFSHPEESNQVSQSTGVHPQRKVGAKENTHSLSGLEVFIDLKYI